MTDSTENLVLEILKRIQADLAELKTGQTALKEGLAALKESQDRIDNRLGFVEQALVSMLRIDTDDRDEIRTLKSRIERIEKRLEQNDAG